MTEFGTSIPFDGPDADPGITVLPLLLRRFKVHIPLEPEVMEEGTTWPGVEVPHTLLDIPPLEIHGKHYAGARYEVFPLPGAGNYEVVVVYALLTDEYLDKIERTQAGIMVEQFDAIDFPEDDNP